MLQRKSNPDTAMNSRLVTTNAKAAQGLCAFVRAGWSGSLMTTASRPGHLESDDRSSPGESCA
jgi:hypothetical protein